MIVSQRRPLLQLVRGCRQRNKSIAAADEERAGADYERVGPLFNQTRKGRIQIPFAFHVQHKDTQPKRPRGLQQVLHLLLGNYRLRVGEHGDETASAPTTIGILSVAFLAAVASRVAPRQNDVWSELQLYELLTPMPALDPVSPGAARGHAVASGHQGASLMGLGKPGRLRVEQPTITGELGPAPDAYTHYSRVMIAGLSKTAGRSAFDEGGPFFLRQAGGRETLGDRGPGTPVGCDHAPHMG